MLNTRIFVALIAICLMSCDSARKSDSDISRSGSNQEVDFIESLNERIVAKPNDPNLYVKRAMAYRDRKMMQLAIRDAQRALAIDSTVSYFHSVLGELEFQSGQLR